MRRKLLIIALACTALLLFSTCKKSSPVNNTEEPNYPPGRRDYVWTVDTVKSFNWIGPMWASSSENIWATSTDEFFHFDGTKWNSVKEPNLWPFALFGFSQNDVWGAKGDRIWHYTGDKWNLHTILPDTLYENFLVSGLWGEKTGELYLYGIARDPVTHEGESALLICNGIKWTRMNFKEKRVQIVSIGKADNIFYLSCQYYPVNSRETYRVYSFDGINAKIIAEGDDVNNAIYQIKNRVFINRYQKIFECKQDGLLLHKDFKGTAYLGGMYGRSINDFFVTIYPYKIAHYNGTDIEQVSGIEQPYGLEPFGCFILPENVILNFRQAGTVKHLIFRGKLK